MFTIYYVFTLSLSLFLCSPPKMNVNIKLKTTKTTLRRIVWKNEEEIHLLKSEQVHEIR